MDVHDAVCSLANVTLGIVILGIMLHRCRQLNPEGYTWRRWTAAVSVKGLVELSSGTEHTSELMQRNQKAIRRPRRRRESCCCC